MAGNGAVYGQRVQQYVGGEDCGGFVEGYRAKRTVAGKGRRWGGSKGLHNVYSEEAAAVEAMKSQPKWRTRIKFGHFTIPSSYIILYIIHKL